MDITKFEDAIVQNKIYFSEEIRYSEHQSFHDDLTADLMHRYYEFTKIIPKSWPNKLGKFYIEKIFNIYITKRLFVKLKRHGCYK